MAPVRWPLAHDIQAAAGPWMADLSAEHDPELFSGEMVAEPGKPITRWFIGSAHAPLPERGRPALTLQFEDVSGDTYDVHIGARKRRAF